MDGTLSSVNLGSSVRYQLTRKEDGRTKTIYVPRRALAGVRHGRSLAAVGRAAENDAVGVGQGDFDGLARDRLCGYSKAEGRGDADAAIPPACGIA